MSKSPLSKNTSHLRNSKKNINNTLNAIRIFQASLNKSHKFKKNKKTSLYKHVLQKKHLANTHSKVKQTKRKKSSFSSKGINNSLLLKPLSVNEKLKSNKRPPKK